MALPPANLIIFDCDSTLSAIEGVDELGGLRGDAVKAEVAALTNRAMAGEIPIDDVFARRLERIRPRRDECAAIGQRYIDEIEPDAEAVTGWLRAHGWEIAIVSGGFVPCIEPLARHLGITRVEAVPLRFDADGGYAGFGHRFPTTRNGGKREIAEALRAEFSPPALVVVGDGVSDLEAKPVADLFVGFGRYAERARVLAEADVFIRRLGELPDVLKARV